MEEYEIVSFIPARGGSERIPKKNIKMIAGKPMIAWTIEASLKSKYIDRTFVSTEDKEIKEVALKYGAEVIDRPAEFSQGQIPITFAYSHFQYCLWKEKYQPDYVIFLHATSPLRTEKHIDEAFGLYFSSDSPLLCSVTPVRILPSNAHIINGQGRLGRIMGGGTKRIFDRDYSKGQCGIYYEDSAIYIGTYCGTDYLTVTYIGSALPYMMDITSSIDVDTPFDFKVAEMLLEERIKERR